MRIVRKILTGVAVLLGLLVCGFFALYLHVSWGLPSVAALKTEEGLRSSLRLAAQPSLQVALLPLSEIPPQVVNACIAAEDPAFAGRSFWDGGVFAQSLSRRLLHARGKRYGHLEGAVLQSNIGLLLNREEILSAWLATEYFGKSTWGVGAAARYYCNKPLSDLTVCEAAMLAGIPKAPAEYNPVDHPERAQKRQQFVLSEMVRLGLASEADAAACK